MKVATVFSGIGAAEQALKRLGINFKLIHWCEIDKYAIKSYKAIHEPQVENLGDITLVDITKLNDFDLLFHGSPCQDFSLAGNRKGGEEGSGTRSSLVWKTLEIVAYKKPKYVILENVKNLASEQFEDDRKKLFNKLEDSGYICYAQTLNAKDYGIPQNRERYFIVAIRSDVDKGFMFPKPIPLKLRLKDLLENEVDEKYYLSEKVLKTLQLFGSYYTWEDNQGNINTQCNRAANPEKCALTVAVGESGKVLENNLRIRRLTPLECWRLMGFDDKDYYKAAKVNSNTQLYKQAGNSIVVNVLEEIFKNLFDDTPKSLFAFEF